MKTKTNTKQNGNTKQKTRACKGAGKGNGKPAGRTPTRTAKKEPTPAKKTGKNKFLGANKIQLTKNKIIVTRTTSENVDGRFRQREERNYYEQTKENMQELSKAIGGKALKKVSFEY